MAVLLEIKNLQVDFITDESITTAVKNISFTVNKGEIVAIVGESGSGKTVSSLSILQLLSSPPAKYSSGQIYFTNSNQESIELLKQSHKALQAIRGNEIAMIFQEPMTSLNPVYTCGNQVMETILVHQPLSKKEARAKAIQLFEQVKLPNPSQLFNRYPHQLSGGQKQRVMIAMAMCCDPSLLIADEPTTALDVTVQKTILELIQQFRQQKNMSVLFITHDLGVVAEIADRVLVMYKGEIVEQGTVQQLFYHPQHWYTKALLACRPALHQKGERLPTVADFASPENEVQLQAKETRVQSELKPHTQETPHPLLQVKELAVWFPARKNFLGNPLSYIKAVDGVSFNVWKGETLGLVGESGCGKTTLGRSLLRLIEPTAGSLLFNGEDLLQFSKKALREIRKEIQIIFQDPYSSLNPRMTIGDAIAEPLKVHKIFDKKNQQKDKVVELLEKVNLKAAHFNRYPHEFSGGQRQRICIARALALSPSFIICDESVSALDVSVQAQVLNLLNDLKNEFNFTTVFISHDLSVVRYISDRILVMHQGKIVEEGSADAIYKHPQNDYTRQLIAAIPKGINPVAF